MLKTIAKKGPAAQKAKHPQMRRAATAPAKSRKTTKQHLVQALSQPSNFVGAQNTWGGSVGTGIMTNTDVKKRKTPMFVDELWCELNAPANSTLVLLAAGNIQPGLAPMTNFFVPSPFAPNALVTPGLGPVADANINPLPNIYGLVKRTNVMSVCYDKWDCDGIEIVYDPGCSGESIQGQSGEVILHAEPNPGQSAPTTLVEALRSKYAATGRACDRIVLRLPRSFFDRKKDYFLRQGPLPWSTSIADFDAGRIHVMCNGIASAANAELGRVSVRAYFHLYDDIDPAESTSISVAAPVGSVLFGMAQSILPTTDTATNNILQCLLQGDNLAYDTSGLPLKMNVSYTNFVLPPGNYGFEAYFNPRLSATSVAGGAGIATITFDIQATNANQAQAVIAHDVTSLTNVVLGAAATTVGEDRTVIVRGYWRSAGSATTTVSLLISLSIAGTASVVWGKVGDNWQGALPNSAQNNPLGCLLRVYAL